MYSVCEKQVETSQWITSDILTILHIHILICLYLTSVESIIFCKYNIRISRIQENKCGKIMKNSCVSMHLFVLERVARYMSREM